MLVIKLRRRFVIGNWFDGLFMYFVRDDFLI